MKPKNLKDIFKNHALWLRGSNKGIRANLTDADLTKANLTDTDLIWANLTGAKLNGANLNGANLTRAKLTRAKLKGANLIRAKLTRANLIDTDLTGAKLNGANLKGAKLNGANLNGANLTGANLDFSVWPLWCGTEHVKVDIRIARQLAAHFVVLDCSNKEYLKARRALLKFAQKSHRAIDLKITKKRNEEGRE